MKIRLDFVSNSSSSSFMLVGHAFDDEELEKGWNALHPGKNFDDAYELPYAIADELGLDVQHGISDYYEMHVLGLPFNKMNDNETKAQFVARIKDALSKAFGDVDVDEIVDGGYDG